MSAVVNVIFQSQEHMYSAVIERIEKTILFGTVKEATDFVQSFGEKYLFDGTESRYVAKFAPNCVGAPVELVYKLSVENNKYVLDHKLLTLPYIENNLALSATYANQSSAYRIAKNGEVLELTNGEVGVHTFYTMNPFLASDLNAELED